MLSKDWNFYNCHALYHLLLSSLPCNLWRKYKLSVSQEKGLYYFSSSLEKTGLKKQERKNEWGLWNGDNGCYMKREYLSGGRSAVIVIHNFTSVGMDLMYCAVDLTVALEVLGSFLEVPRCVSILYLSSLQSTGRG